MLSLNYDYHSCLVNSIGGINSHLTDLTLAKTTCHRSGAISAHLDIALWDSF